MNVATILSMAADGNPDRVAIGGRADGVTYGQLRAMSGAQMSGSCGSSVVKF